MLSAERLADFERDGFVVIPSLLSARDLRALRRELTGLARESESKGQQHLSSVVPAADRCAYQFEQDRSGRIIKPYRLHKAQGVALDNRAVLSLLRMETLAHVAMQLSGIENGELDAFGTKFFPVRAGSGGSVGWHDDNYYFGTTRSRTISCVVYLRDTSVKRGALRVYPGSHRDAQAHSRPAHSRPKDPSANSI